MKVFRQFLHALKYNRKTKGDEVSKMVSGIQKLGELTAKDVMVPRVDMVAVDIGYSPEELFKTVANSIHSRFPVYEDTVDNVVGILYVKDLLKVSDDIKSLNINAIIRQPFFVPEAMYLNMLLHEMKKRRIHIAIVVDEYGGVSGIVCLEDIIEEIVGDILDEFDNETEEFLKIAPDTYLVGARLPVEKFNELLHVSIPQEDYDTVGGYVYNLFGKIPACYEKVSYENIDFVIQTMQGNIIKSIKITLHNNGKK